MASETLSIFVLKRELRSANLAAPPATLGVPTNSPLVMVFPVGSIRIKTYPVVLKPKVCGTLQVFYGKHT